MDRRALISALAVAPVFASGWAASARTGPRFAPPPTPMRLERTLIRHLSGDASLAVTRSWVVRISPVGRGFQVSGEQVGAHVAAPPGLAAMARLEEARIDEGMFPLSLDRHGHVIGGTAAGTDDALEDAVRLAQTMIGQAALDAASTASADMFLSSLQQAGSSALSDWPRTLFGPTGSTGTIEREIAIPGQAAGIIRLDTEAAAAPETGLLLWMNRRIETRIGTSARASEERWTLT